mgnify:CR=1 FL=1
MTRIGWKSTVALILAGIGLTVMAYIASSLAIVIGGL